ncbi:RNA polymerase sigma-70 factor [uncultured Phocaeicola sp.]|uniref:RNA polymerase sigma-70 factor n=1 Tax=uncultured Phocaeicola sp. TaxID=990718 RepID=UPI00258DD42A|nr:RNA polymerase sigma-70 factor [uncultured Phocaeicola sp.]
MNNTDTPINEREIVLRLIDGDEDAFCELYATYKNRLLYFAMRFVKSRDFAEDIFQDAFTVIWQGRRFIDPNASFSSYLYTIMRNRILNQIRDMEKEDTLKESILSQAIDYSDDTKNNILSGDLKNIIQKAFESLTPRQQEIFRMSREELLSHKEIADKLGISIHTVQEHISLALHTIRTYLTKYSDTYADLLLILICMNL